MEVESGSARVKGAFQDAAQITPTPSHEYEPFFFFFLFSFFFFIFWTTRFISLRNHEYAPCEFSRVDSTSTGVFGNLEYTSFALLDKLGH